MKKLIAAFSVLFLIIPINQALAGYLNEPNGFRYIFFGAHLKDLEHLKLEKIRELKEEKHYVVKGDQLRIGKGEVENILYVFSYDRFGSVLVEFRSFLNFRRIREDLFNVYGKTLNIKKGAFENLIWKGDRVDILLTFNTQKEKGGMRYWYSPVMGKIPGELDLQGQIDINDAKKTKDRLNALIEDEEKATAIRKRKMMKEDLSMLREKCQKKLDYLNEQSRRALSWSGSADVLRDIENLRKECQKEEEQIRQYYDINN